jgi:HEAT repeat protein
VGIDELIQQLMSDDEEQRGAAADQLIQAGAEAVGPLLDILRDPDRKTPPAVSYIIALSSRLCG